MVGAAAIGQSKMRAEAGDPSAMVAWGMALAMGQSVPRDERATLSWYLKAAGKGDVGAMLHLGACLRDGVGVKADASRAISSFEKAANAGHTILMFPILSRIRELLP